MFILAYSKIILILASVILTLACCLNPISKESRYLGYAFITTISINLFPVFFQIKSLGFDYKTETFEQFISFLLPIVIILMSTFKPSIKSDKQMLSVAVIINIIFAGIILFKPDVIMWSFDSKIMLTIFFTLNLVLLYILHNKKLQEFFKIIFLFSLGNLLISIYNLGYGTILIENVGFIVTTLGYLLSIVTIYKDYRTLSHKQIEFQNQLTEDFDDAVQKEVRKQTRRVEWSKEQLKQKSEIDNLTGALLKKPLVDLIDSYIHDLNIKKFSILMFDIDNFKSLNDIYGHITGDKCLKDLVAIAVSSINFKDSIGRYGGDEFVIVLPHQPAGKALNVANRFRENIMKQTDPKYTISVGVASYPWDGDNYKKLIQVADAGLYKSKENGRNSASYTGVLNTSHEFNG